MKCLIFVLFFSLSAFAQKVQNETVEILNALADNQEDFSRFLKKSEKVLIFKTQIEVLDENKKKIQIYGKKLREGDILDGEIILEIEKITIPQSEGPDLIKYDSRFKRL